MKTSDLHGPSSWQEVHTDFQENMETHEEQLEASREQTVAEIEKTLEQSFPAEDELSLHREIVGETEIDNFSESGLVSDAEVKDFIEANVPSEHLGHLDGIEYINDPATEELGILGSWTSLPFGNHIDIYPHNEREQLIATVTHEVGHNAHWILENDYPEAFALWEELHNESTVNDFVSDYASTSPWEDFAENYDAYVNYPDVLQDISPDKYDFMKEYVFHGHEYV
jgi:hypothetical protein